MKIAGYDLLWKTGRLGDFLTLKRGYDLPKGRRSGGVIPVVSSSGVSDYHSLAMAKGPGVVTGRYGTIGEVFYIDCPFWPLNTALYVSDFKGNDPRFVSYLLRTLDFLAYSDKGAVPGINRNHLHEAIITFPVSVDEQRAIASILGALDDKIELNRKMSATLEAIARALFKSWFVDFDPVRAKAEGRDPGLPAEIAALFPNSFEETAHGQIPSGWLTKSISDMAEPSRATINPGNFPDEYFEHYSIPAYDTGRGPIIERGEAIKSNKFIVLTDAVLLSRLNPRTPRIWMPKSIGPRRAICSTEFAVMHPKLYSKEWLYCLFSNQTFCDNLTTMVTGTSGSHQRVRPESLLAMPTIAPAEQVIQTFTSIVGPFLTRVALAQNESLTLAALRDALLRKLISGELRVGEADRVLAASA